MPPNKKISELLGISDCQRLYHCSRWLYLY